jgi:hypothetical protein
MSKQKYCVIIEWPDQKYQAWECEAWIEDLAARPAGWCVWVERIWSPESIPQNYIIATRPTEAEAEQTAEDIRSTPGPGELVRVWVEREVK